MSRPAVEHVTHSPEETMALAQRLASSLRPGDVVALDGELGAGKTCFVRGLAAGLGVDPHRVSSPTFVILHEYSTPEGATVLIHLDAWRLSSPEDLATVGWAELLERGDAISAVEWPGRILDALPESRIDVTLEHLGGDERRITISRRPLQNRGQDSTAPQPSRCPTCGAEVSRDGEFLPFCSHRCRLVDLGKWLGGEYRLSRPADDARDADDDDDSRNA